jgi:hypothetical protein
MSSALDDQAAAALLSLWAPKGSDVQPDAQGPVVSGAASVRRRKRQNTGALAIERRVCEVSTLGGGCPCRRCDPAGILWNRLRSRR